MHYFFSLGLLGLIRDLFSDFHPFDISNSRVDWRIVLRSSLSGLGMNRDAI